MKCPMTTEVQWDLGKRPEYHYPDCLQNECAWWMAGSKQCAIALLATELEGIKLMLFAKKEIRKQKD